MWLTLRRHRGCVSFYTFRGRTDGQTDGRTDGQSLVSAASQALVTRQHGRRHAISLHECRQRSLYATSRHYAAALRADLALFLIRLPWLSKTRPSMTE